MRPTNKQERRIIAQKQRARRGLAMARKAEKAAREARIRAAREAREEREARKARALAVR